MKGTFLENNNKRTPPTRTPRVKATYEVCALDFGDGHRKKLVFVDDFCEEAVGGARTRAARATHALQREGK